VDRRSVRRSQRRTLDPQNLQPAVALCHERCTLRRIARLCYPSRFPPSAAPSKPWAWAAETHAATGAGAAIPVGAAWRHDPRRHEQLARFDRVGHRITGDRRLGRSAGGGYEKAHVVINTARLLAYAEVLPDEKQATTVGFLIRAVAWFGPQGIKCRGGSRTTAAPTAANPACRPVGPWG
jgi:hypothetical protein